MSCSITGSYAQAHFSDAAVGSIVASVLDYSTFSKVNKQPIIFDITKSKWAPADGRKVNGSKYGAYAGTVPDLRGVFLRGLNKFYVGMPDNTLQADPDIRTAGSFQADSIKRHKHVLNDPGHTHPVASGYSTAGGSNGKPGGELTNGGNGNGDKNVHPALQNTTGITLNEYGGAETRPKNIAVYYYIRIN